MRIVLFSPYYNSISYSFCLSSDSFDRSYFDRLIAWAKNASIPYKQSHVCLENHHLSYIRCCRKKIALDLKPYISVVNYNLAEKKIISLKMPIFLLPKKVCNLTDMQTLIRTLIVLWESGLGFACLYWIKSYWIILKTWEN